MTEQEIISCLKENRKKGVAFAFMPSEVQDWCAKHFSEDNFHILDDGKWGCKKTSVLCCPDNVYCLDADYKEFKPYLQEFDIDEDGYFEFEGKRYYYREDARFETENRNKFRGFGGWLYEGKDFDLWTTVPHLLYGGHLYDTLRSDQNAYERTVPIPTKIRFWRYAK